MRIRTRGPLIIEYTSPRDPSITLVSNTSHWWTEDGHRVGFLTPSWRHALTLGEPFQYGADLAYPITAGGPYDGAGHVIARYDHDAEQWWNDDRQPDADLTNLIRNT
jgi:hypothetical protein